MSLQATSKLNQRFSELSAQMDQVEATKQYKASEFLSGDRIDDEVFLNWRVKARHLLLMACGQDSEHYKEFMKGEKPKTYQTNYENFRLLKATFLAAKEDFEGGYLSSVRNLIQAQVFSNELDQSSELLTSGYASAAAVIAGVVLETTLRQMCEDRNLAIGKLDRMNSELSKAGVYNLLVQKQITALADIRNNAAHGHPENFKDSDVRDMIAYVEAFVSQHLS